MEDREMNRNPSIEKEDGRRERRSAEEEQPMRWNPSVSTAGLGPGGSRLEEFQIPPGAGTLEGVRRWSWSESFPEPGRIDFLDGELEIDLSPENLYQHGTVKTAIAAALHEQ